MSFKRWLVTFAAAAILTALCFCAFNFFVDPFGIFGDMLLDQYSYNMTQNPRAAKVAYLDRHFQSYDSYIIGCSKTSSIPVQQLNEGFGGASFYNMLMYGGDMFDVEMTSKYVLENYTVHNLVINMGFEELAVFDFESDPIKGRLHAKVDGSSLPLFYARYLLLNPGYAADKLEFMLSERYLPTPNSVFNTQTGAYDKRLRDIEPLGSLDDYLKKYPEFSRALPSSNRLAEAQSCLDVLSRIKAMCEQYGASFTLIISPLYDSELSMFFGENLLQFLKDLAQITPYWDFSGYTAVSAEPRYFYDFAHFRNNVGQMMAARIFGNGEGVFLPQGFGEYVTAQNVEQRLSRYQDGGSGSVLDAKLAVLLYHEVSQQPDPDNKYVISETLFSQQLEALKQAGYTAVSIYDIIDFVEKGADLPEKPVLITFDDGYLNNVTLAADTLRRHEMRAVVFAIGVSVGADSYKDTGVPIFPHFSWRQALDAADVIDVQSHSFDLHRNAELDGDNYRYAMTIEPGESIEDYIELFTRDFELFEQAIFEGLGASVDALAYPHGAHDDLTEVLLDGLGVKATFTTVHGVNTLVKGLPQSLKRLNRLSVYPGTTPGALVEALDQLMQ